MVFVTNNRGAKDIFNGFLKPPPGNPIFLNIINYMYKVGNNFNNDYYFNCKKLYSIVNSYMPINLNQQLYKIENRSLCLLIDRGLNYLKISDDWEENNKFGAFYNNILLFIECNKYYPYKKS